MKISLRKANAIQNTVNDTIKGLDLNTQVTLNEFEDVQDQIQAVRDRFWTNTDLRSRLTTALYEIRARVAQANAESGINDLLANAAYLEKQISYNNQMASRGVQTALRVLNGQVKKIADARDDYSYSRRDAVTSIFTEQEVEQFRKDAADLKREKQHLQDRLLELNVQTEIELTASTADFLVKANIL
jgi:hypothetical protein